MMGPRGWKPTDSNDPVTFPSERASAPSPCEHRLTAIERGPGPCASWRKAHGIFRTASHAGATIEVLGDDPTISARRREPNGRRRSGERRSAKRLNPSEPLATASSLRTWPRAMWTPRGSSREARWCSRVMQEDRCGSRRPSSSSEEKTSWKSQVTLGSKAERAHAATSRSHKPRSSDAQKAR